MNAFYNGKPITKENLLTMIKECIEAGWENSSLHKSTETRLEKIYYGRYEGAEEDIEYILYKLKSKPAYGNGYFYPKPDLLDVETIISLGSWYFQEAEMEVEKMLKLLERDHGEEKTLCKGNLKKIIEYLQNNEDLINWILDEDPTAELPILEKVETVRDLKHELSKINLSWWALEIEEE